MASGTDKKSLLEKIGVVAGGIAAAVPASLYYIKQAMKTNIFEARLMSQDERKPSNVQPLLFFHDDTGHLTAVKNALNDEQSVLGKAKDSVLMHPDNEALYQEIAGFPEKMNKYATMHEKVQTGQVAEERADAIINTINRQFPTDRIRYVAAEERLAELTTKEVPLLEKIKIKNLHLNGEQKLTAGLVFAGVASVTGYAIHSIASWMGREKSEPILPPDEIAR